ncbi:hypothetical protein RHMOL_Rhmol09G0196500 [Rhododendron molle]|uniref:Uncharacterized protein n=1 Tax=Rhododendron molle TaxID=49168 RepID=A0ACC0MFI4_RHOML|nr:hypothetical protein RHMOL_Rhmol09G0196500 [Rhododendron molle]
MAESICMMVKSNSGTAKDKLDDGGKIELDDGEKIVRMVLDLWLWVLASVINLCLEVINWFVGLCNRFVVFNL